jgi:DNA polymerase
MRHAVDDIFPSVPGSLGASGGRLERWGYWQHNLDAELVVIGQDWQGQESLMTHSEESLIWIQKHGEACRQLTNWNLRQLLLSIGFDPGTPEAPQFAPLYFANIVPSMPDPRGKMDHTRTQRRLGVGSEVEPGALKQLIELIRPRALVCLGSVAFSAAWNAFGLPGRPPGLLAHIEASDVPTLPGLETKLFGFFACGKLGTAQRSLEMQFRDWAKLKRVLEKRET